MPDRLIICVRDDPRPFHLVLPEADALLSTWARDVWALPDQSLGAGWVRSRLIDVCEALLALRIEALSQGAHRLGPLTQAQLAASSGLEPADVSRVVRNVVLDIGGEHVEPDALFSQEVNDSQLSGLQLRALVLAMSLENPTAGDQAQADRLNDVGVRVERRTVANVRDRLGLPPGMRRRRWDETAWAVAVDAASATLPGTAVARRALVTWASTPRPLAQRVADCRAPTSVLRPSRLPAVVARFAAECAAAIGGPSWEDMDAAERKRVREGLLRAVNELFFLH